MCIRDSTNPVVFAANSARVCSARSLNPSFSPLIASMKVASSCSVSVPVKREMVFAT